MIQVFPSKNFFLKPSNPQACLQTLKTATEQNNFFLRLDLNLHTMRISPSDKCARYAMHSWAIKMTKKKFKRKAFIDVFVNPRRGILAKAATRLVKEQLESNCFAAEAHVTCHVKTINVQTLSELRNSIESLGPFCPLITSHYELSLMPQCRRSEASRWR